MGPSALRHVPSWAPKVIKRGKVAFANHVNGFVPNSLSEWHVRMRRCAQFLGMAALKHDGSNTGLQANLTLARPSLRPIREEKRSLSTCHATGEKQCRGVFSISVQIRCYLRNLAEYSWEPRSDTSTVHSYIQAVFILTSAINITPCRSNSVNEQCRRRLHQASVVMMTVLRPDLPIRPVK